MYFFWVQINSHFVFFFISRQFDSIQTTKRQIMDSSRVHWSRWFRPSPGSVVVGYSADAGTADGHRSVWSGEAATPVLPVQDQDVLVDRDWVQVVCVSLSRVQTGTEAADALGLPDGGGDPVRHRGRPDRTKKSHHVVILASCTESRRRQKSGNIKAISTLLFSLFKHANWIIKFIIRQKNCFCCWNFYLNYQNSCQIIYLVNLFNLINLLINQ